MVFGWFKKLKSGLSKSSEKISEGIKKVVKGKKIDEKMLLELEDLLISSDLGVSFSSQVIDDLGKSKIIEPTPKKVKEIIQKKIKKILEPLEKELDIKSELFVLLVVGVNGVGKTATVGKIAHKLISNKKKVGLVAADTFRAAAVDQLKIWSQRTNAEFFSGKEGSDPAALAYESIQKAIEKKIDVLIIDTAGRLHNKTDLMNELSKIIRVIKKIDESYPNEISLVLDGNIGQNSIKQAEVFKDICNINSLIITKLDGTAKGGVLVPIADQLRIPILSIGIGEQKNDLIDFKAKDFSKTLLDLD
jgi:fused signal recognition particle receptor